MSLRLQPSPTVTGCSTTTRTPAGRRTWVTGWATASIRRVLAQPEMEKRRSPLVQIPPLRDGDFQGMRLYRPMTPSLYCAAREQRPPRLLGIGSMSPPDYAASPAPM
jgi:hypothetical protein